MTAKQTIQIVEIDVDFCTLSYGTGACTAALGTTGSAKCFNTFKTCQDEANFDRGTNTLRFAKNQEGLPKGQTIFPALQSVTTNPLRVNISAIDKNLTPLGRSERVTVNLKDFLYGDVLTDKYSQERISGAAIDGGVGYNPRERGTFFGKLKARSPFYYGRPLRVLNGEVGQALSAMQTRHYIIDEIIGPDANGNVKIIARDVLGLLGKDTALCPAISPGRAAATLTGAVTSFDIAPPGIGASYPTSGFGTINGKLIQFTRSGDTITDVNSTFGTGAISDALAIATGNDTPMKEGDSFQLSYQITDKTVSQAIGDIIRDFSEVPDAQIDQVAWEAETATYAPDLRVDGLVVQPTPIRDIIAEFCRLGVVVWADTLGEKIEFRTIRNPTAPELTALSDDASFLEGSVKVKDRTDLRVSQVAIYYDQIAIQGDNTRPDNFRRLLVSADLPSEGENEYNQSQFKTLFSRFVGSNFDTEVGDIADTILARHVNTPSDIEFTVDVKDRDAVKIMDAVEITTRVIAGPDGAPFATKAQVKEVEEISPNSRLRVVAQTYE